MIQWKNKQFGGGAVQQTLCLGITGWHWPCGWSTPDFAWNGRTLLYQLSSVRGGTGQRNVGMTTSATSHIEEGQARTWKTRWRLSGVIKNRNYQAHIESVILTTAFRHAPSSRCKTDVLEIDLHETLDGVPVVCHDPNLQRLCGRDIEVSQVNFCGKHIIASIRQPCPP